METLKWRFLSSYYSISKAQCCLWWPQHLTSFSRQGPHCFSKRNQEKLKCSLFNFSTCPWEFVSRTQRWYFPTRYSPPPKCHPMPAVVWGSMVWLAFPHQQKVGGQTIYNGLRWLDHIPEKKAGLESRGLSSSLLSHMSCGNSTD